MNIPEMLVKYLANGETLNSISSAVGIGKEDATRAVSASIPALLATFAQTASSSHGARQLANAVSQLDASLLDNIPGALSVKGGQLAQQGSGILSSLVGGGQVSALSGILARITGLGEGAAGKVLSMLSPLVLGFLGRQTAGLGASGLVNLLQGQKDNIKSAMPPGLSSMMSSALPGFADFFGGAKQQGDAAASAARDIYEHSVAAPSRARWVVPALVALVVLAFVVFWSRRQTIQQEPAVAVQAPVPSRTIPEAIGAPARSVTGAATSANFVSDTSDLISDATKALADVRDTASANTAVEKLKEINAKLESARSSWTSLPDSARTLALSTFTPLVAKLEETVQPVLSMPAVGDMIRPHVNELLKNVKAFTSPPAP
jgi:hypothetical protein